MAAVDDAAKEAADAAKAAENAAADAAQKAAEAHRANANAGDESSSTDIPILGDLLP